MKVGLNASALVAVDPDSIPDTLPITKAMHERIVTDDGMNPSSRTNRAIFAAIAQLEAALTNKGTTK